MPNAPRINHDMVNETIVAFNEFTCALERPALAERAKPMADRYRTGEYRLVLVGEEKRGKSSLVSALLGAPGLLPSGPEPMTACVFKLVYGPEVRRRVFFLPGDPEAPDSSRAEPLEVSADALAAFGTEAGNPDNEKGVDFIQIEHPHPLLEAGLTIVDLPGLGGLKREHGVLTMSHLANADAAFFVVDSIAGALNREEVATLERLQEFTNHIVFVQTKIDAVSSIQWRKWRERNLQEIEERLGIPLKEISYFPVSNTLKTGYDRSGEMDDLSESGFEPLIGFLQDELIPQKLDRLAQPVLAIIANLTVEAGQQIENEIIILEAGSQEEIDRVESMLRDAQARYEEWQRDDQPRTITRFKDDFRLAEIEAERAVARDLDPSDQGPIVGPEIAQLEADDVMSASDIVDASASLNDRAVNACGLRLDAISKVFDERTMNAFARAAREVAVGAAPLRLNSSNCHVEVAFERPQLKNHVTVWSTLMQGRLGLMSGTMIAGAVASMFFPPFSLAVAAVSLLGGLFGAERSIRDGQQRERVAAENRLRMLLIDTVRRLQQNGFREFRTAAELRRKAMLEALHDVIKQRGQDENAANKAMQSGRQQTTEQLEERLLHLGALKVRASAIIEMSLQSACEVASEMMPAAS